MSHTPHELAEEFPAQTDLISRLKQSDAHFAKLVDTYHDLNRSIHRAETDVEPMADTVQAMMRKQRLALKDQIAALLKAA